jgi:hypothetical protein
MKKRRPIAALLFRWLRGRDARISVEQRARPVRLDTQWNLSAVKAASEKPEASAWSLK